MTTVDCMIITIRNNYGKKINFNDLSGSLQIIKFKVSRFVQLFLIMLKYVYINMLLVSIE